MNIFLFVSFISIIISPPTSRMRQRSKLKVDRGGLVLGRFAGNVSKQIASGGHASNFLDDSTLIDQLN